MSDNEDDIVVVHLVSYDDQLDVEVEHDDDDYPRVTNHDELAKTDVARCFKKGGLPDALDAETIEPGDSLWRDEFADMDVGDEIEL